MTFINDAEGEKYLALASSTRFSAAWGLTISKPYQNIKISMMLKILLEEAINTMKLNKIKIYIVIRIELDRYKLNSFNLLVRV